MSCTRCSCLTVLVTRRGVKNKVRNVEERLNLILQLDEDSRGALSKVRIEIAARKKPQIDLNLSEN